jgi:hypothetical protein
VYGLILPDPVFNKMPFDLSQIVRLALCSSPELGQVAINVIIGVE